jgi:hypothetical protein
MQSVQDLSSPNEQLSLKERIVGEACRMLSHASRGRRYPLMTAGEYPANPRGMRW